MAESCRHFRKASLCKQTAYYNSLCSQAKTQSAVTAWCLRSGLHCFFIFFFHFSIEQQHRWDKPRPPVEAPSAHNESLNQYLSSDKKVPRVFFFFSFGGSEALFKGAWLFLPQCNSKGPWHFFFFYVQQHLETLDRSVFSFSKDRKKKKGRFLKTDAHSVSRGIARLQQRKSRVKKQNKNKKKQIKRICFLDLQVFFFSLFVIAIQGRCAT